MNPTSYRQKLEVQLTSIVKLVAAAVLVVFAQSASAQTVWNLATAYQDDNFHTQNIARFAADVEAMTGGEVKITLHTTLRYSKCRKSSAEFKPVRFKPVKSFFPRTDRKTRFSRSMGSRSFPAAQ